MIRLQNKTRVASCVCGSLFKSLLINRNFLECALIGWQHNCQPDKIMLNNGHPLTATLPENFVSNVLPWCCYCIDTSWRHQMETFSAQLAIYAGNSPVPVNSPHKRQWRGALMFYLICVWIHGWVNNREAGDLRRHRGHYDSDLYKPRGIEHKNRLCIFSHHNGPKSF